VALPENEDLYQRSVAVRLAVRETARNAWKEASGKFPTNEIQFDLGGEELTAAIIAKPYALKYLQRFWKTWTDLPGGISDTIGYSMIGSKSENILTLWNAVYFPSGVYPKVIAVDCYPNSGALDYKDLNELLDAIAIQIGITRPVVILESYWDDAQNVASLLEYLKSPLAKSLKIDSYLSWQMSRQTTSAHFDRDYAIIPLRQGVDPLLNSKALLK
jgi:hypothetical protein